MKANGNKSKNKSQLLNKKRNLSAERQLQIYNNINNQSQKNIEIKNKMKLLENEFKSDNNDFSLALDKQKDDYFDIIKLEER